jgi:hypothetical protein
MARIIPVSQHGDVTRWFSSERDGSGQLVHYRGHRQNVEPILNRVKQRAAEAPGRFGKSGEIKYVGSIPRAMLEDWLSKRGKTMHDYATDEHLKRSFTLFLTAERPAFFMKHYQV